MNAIPPQDDRTRQVLLATFRRQMWGMLAAGLMIGFIGMQAIIVNPMKRNIDGLRQQVVAMESDMADLVGIRDQARQTNTLLGQLKLQKSKVEEARQALDSISRFRLSLEAEAEQTVSAVESLKTFSGMRQTLVEQRESLDPAFRTLNELVDLQDRVLGQKQSSREASEVFADMASLQEQIVAQGDATPATAGAIDAISELQERIVGQSEGTAVANRALDRTNDVFTRLGELAGAAGCAADDCVSAGEAVAHLGELKRNAIAQGTDLDAARRNLDVLLTMESKLSGRTNELAETVRTIELLADFSEELRAQIQSLDGLRRNLVEIGMLETSLGRAMRVLEPLSQIANLRRLSESEVRDAARVILQQRTRLSSVDRSEAAEAQLPERREDGLVPTP